MENLLSMLMKTVEDFIRKIVQDEVNKKPIEVNPYVVQAVAEKIDLNELASEVARIIDLSDLQRHLDYDDLGENIRLNELARNIDIGELAEEIRLSDLADEFDTEDITNAVSKQLSTPDMDDIKEQIRQSIELDDLVIHLIANKLAARLTAQPQKHPLV